MSGTWIIFKREISQYLSSPTAYIIAFAFLLLTAIFFNRDLAVSVGNKPIDTSAVPSFLSFGMIFFAPILTMRMLAEEGREGTLELLLTAPIKDSSIVIGKFFSAWVFFSVLLIATLFYLVIASTIITTTIPDFGIAASAYIGIWLYGGATLAIGLMFSSMTENQIVAAFLSISTLLFLWLADQAGQVVANIELANLIRKLSLQGHFAPSFAFGLARAEDVAFFAGIITIALFITIRIVESHRWR